ncbi:hypothetical protein K457DRAFT_875224 [Linnemannia elongata AG-77]|uniref:Uncharacterized protein n=1 Tax=Linnemannia elongata AG-77 TaxID=1314771 RepID=A0A197JHC9_9FUNG|nr:hypothetical protein K457DRAFT_875224 [Linnemannia elongata AG-77]
MMSSPCSFCFVSPFVHPLRPPRRLRLFPGRIKKSIKTSQFRVLVRISFFFFSFFYFFLPLHTHTTPPHHISFPFSAHTHTHHPYSPFTQTPIYPPPPPTRPPLKSKSQPTSTITYNPPITFF